MTQPLIYIVLVNYNGYADTIECVGSLYKLAYANWRCVIVDNGSTNDSVEQLKRHVPDVALIRHPTNSGFAAGNNFGLKHALENGADYVLFLNNDTTVATDLLDRLVDTASAQANIGAVGAKIYFFDDPQRVWWAGGKLQLASGVITNLGYGELDSNAATKPFEVDYITGCVVMVKRAVLLKVGNWAEEYFHTAEDVDLSVRIRQAGYRLVVNPVAHVWHKVSQTGGGDLSPLYLYYLERNRLWLVRKYGNWMPGVSWLKLLPIIIKRFGAAVVKARSFKSVMAIAYAILDFTTGRTGRYRF